MTKTLWTERATMIIQDSQNDMLIDDLHNISQWACCRGHAALEQDLDKMITTLMKLRASSSCPGQDYPAKLALRDLDSDT